MSNQFKKPRRPWKPTLQSEVSQLKLERLRSMLAKEPMTRKEIMSGLSCAKDAAHRYLQHLRTQQEVYIHHWERNLEGGQPFAYFFLGDGKDSPKPRALSESEQSRRQRRKMKRDDPAKYCRYLERGKHRAKISHRQGSGQPFVPADPMLAWIPRADRKAAV